MDKIELHGASKEFLRTVFNRYTDEPLPSKLVGTFTIHMYAESDTRDEGGEVNGYCDSLFFRLDIYDVVNFKKYSVSNKDGVQFRGTAPLNIRIFKDGSTALFTRSDVEICINQCVDIVPLGCFEQFANHNTFIM